MPPRVLGRFEAQVIESLLMASPKSLTRRLQCSVAQARSLQHYLVLVFVAAYRRTQGLDAVSVSLRADALLRRLPPQVRTAIGEALAPELAVPQSAVRSSGHERRAVGPLRQMDRR